jgi:NUDE protein, C-terminal conserved region
LSATCNNPYIFINVCCLYFKKLSLQILIMLFILQENSRDLEQELEAQLEQADTRFRELQIVSSRCQNENEAYKSRLEQLQQQYHHQLTEMEDELVQRRGSNDEYVTYIRELEQRNDEFERSTRIMHATIEDLETKLNSAIERNAFIESELDEKETLKTAVILTLIQVQRQFLIFLRIQVQRLKDESRDLRQELKVRERRELPDVENKKNIDLTKSHDRLIRFDADSSVSGMYMRSAHAATCG